MCCVLCAVLYLVLLCVLFFHFMLKCIEMYASEAHTHALLCHRSKVCYRILYSPFFQIRTIRRKQRHEVAAPRHNNRIVNTSKSSANALAGWHREEPHEYICTTYQYIRRKTFFFAQRIVISENLQDNEKKKRRIERKNKQTETIIMYYVQGAQNNE